MAQVDTGTPSCQPCHCAEAADPSQARDLPQIPCHGHLDLLAWISSRRTLRLAAASLPGCFDGRFGLWERNVPLRIPFGTFPESAGRHSAKAASTPWGPRVRRAHIGSVDHPEKA
ncbi:hypothetical protein GCM10010372_16160 [Streptomyces tauricus]|nr:hypothetical protein GCM10010372_16160 [Streptomyces tauricus]